MLRATQARARNEHSGEPILSPFNSLNADKVFIRKGQVTLVAGGPGTGKSALTQSIVQRGDGHGRRNSVFYFSADSSTWDIYARAAAIATGRTLGSIEDELKQEGPRNVDLIVNDATKHIWCAFDASPSDQYVNDNLMAYAEVHGAYPEVIIMDNLKNLDTGNNDDEWRALEDGMIFLQDVARQTGAAVIALHHVGGNFEDGYSQIPLSGLRGKIGKTPAMVLTLHRGNDTGLETLNVSVVKQRTGPANANGSYYYKLLMDLSSMSFTG